MSNIFEIDGEIEDMDENGDKKKNSDKIRKDENQPTEGIENTHFNDEKDSSQKDDNIESSDNQEDEEPWYNKYLPEEERDNKSIKHEQQEDDNVGERDNDAHNQHDEETNAEVPDEAESNVGISQDFDDGDSDDAYDKPEGGDFDDNDDDNADNVYYKSGEDDSDQDDEDDNEDENLPSIADVTDQEIEEVLAELEDIDEIYSSSDQDDDAIVPPSDRPRRDDIFNEMFPKSNKSGKTTMSTWIFLVLFLITFSLLVYYQFYDGQSMKISFAHKSTAGITRIDSIGNEFKAQLETLENQQKIIAELRDKIKELHEKNFEILSDSGKTVSTPIIASPDKNSSPAVNINSGTYFQIQVIALQDYHPDFGASNFNFYVDKEGGYSKMLIGALQNEKDAKLLYEKVKKSGFDDAFIVKKVNGKRVEYNPFK